MTVYPSFSRVPVDDPPEWEGDDSHPLGSAVRYTPTRALASFTAVRDAAGAVAHNIVVPFVPLHENARGDAVYALKRANARFRGKGRLAMLQAQPRAVRRTWGSFFTREFTETQRRIHVPPTGEYDIATWRALAPWFDSYSLALLHSHALLLPPEIGALLAWMQAFYSTRLGKAYSQLRPSQLGKAELISRADCSGMVAGGNDWAHILPKVDWRYTNTDSQIKFGVEVPSLQVAKIGDTVLYGHGTDPNHEAILVTMTPEPTVLSMGSYPARMLPVDYDRDGRGQRISIRRFHQW